jgi:hypothetical protein
MNEVLGINLEQLNLTEAEAQELASALDLLSDQSITTEKVLKKYAELALYQTVAQLGESEEGYRDVPNLAQQAEAVAAYTALLKIADTLHEMAGQAEGEAYREHLDKTADAYRDQASIIGEEVVFAAENGTAGAVGGSVQEALKSIAGDTRTTAKFLGAGAGAVTSAVFVAYELKQKVADLEELKATGAPSEKIAEKEVEIETYFWKNTVAIPTTTIAGYFATGTSGFTFIAGSSVAGFVCASAVTAIGLGYAFKLGWEVGTYFNENVDWLQDGRSLDFLDSIFGPEGLLERRGEYSIQHASEFSLLHTLLRTLDTDLSPEDFNLMLDSSVGDHRDLAEAKVLLNAVREIFGLSPATFEQEVDLVRAIWETNKATQDWHGKVDFVPLQQFEAKVFEIRAIWNDAEGLAYRYALQELNPFVLTGIDYAIHNQNHELDRYNSDSGRGTLTENWLKDRAAMLARLLAENIAPINLPLFDNNRYEDVKSGIVLEDSLSYWRDLNIVFGSDQEEVLRGTNRNDHLYGEASIDKLYGQQGANYLEGGAGEDEYFIVSDGEADTVLDVDHQGTISLDSVALTGGKGGTIRGGQAIWKNTDGTIAYRLDGSTLEVIKNNDVQIRILDFKPADKLPSLAVTFRLRSPISPAPGVPERVLVAASNESHAGSAEPSASVTAKLSASPSGSTNRDSGSVRKKVSPSLALWAGMLPTASGD